MNFRSNKNKPVFDESFFMKMATFSGYNHVGIESCCYEFTYRIVFKKISINPFTPISSTSIYLDDENEGPAINVLFTQNDDITKGLENISLKDKDDIISRDLNGNNVVLWPKGMCKEEAEIRLDLLINEQ